MDYADWLTPERLLVEEAAWSTAKLHLRYAAAITRLVREHGVNIGTIAELGCGTGWVPTEIDALSAREGLSYIGIDRNAGCLELARERNATREWVTFRRQEIRDCRPQENLVCAFAVLKHFRLDEWATLFAQLFRQTRFGLFTIPIAETSKEDGTEFTHVWLSEADLAAALKLAGHRELWRDLDATEPVIATRRL